MKKIILLVSAIATIVSCTKIETVSTAQPKEIAFKSIEGAMTKAALDHGLDLGVYAVPDTAPTTEYFPLTKFTFGTHYWEGTTKRYWPNSGSLRFFIFSPYSAATINKTERTISQTSVAAATDFLYVDPLPVSTKADYVSAPLKHAKAMIIINAKTNADYAGKVEYKITNISYGTTSTEGTVTITYGETSPHNASVAWTDAKTALLNWTAGATVIYNSNQYSEITSNKIIPQAVQEITVTYTLNGIETSQKITTASGNWEAGKKYIYNLIFTPSEIKVDATDEGWTEPGKDASIDIPIKEL